MPLPVLLAPGSKFPAVVLATAAGGVHDLGAPPSEPDRHKLIVVLRGQFCPFCRATVLLLEEKAAALEAAGVDVIAVWADAAETTNRFAAAVGCRTTKFGVGLTEAQMRQIGVFVSNPTRYVEQEYLFAEPAYFMLNDRSEIRYSCVSSHPMGGRPNVDALLAGLAFVKQKSLEHPEFNSVTWGSA